MKTQIFSALAALVFVGFISTTSAMAQEQVPTDQIQHGGHLPDPATSPAEPMKMGYKKGMMGTMDMDHMQSMMNECMKSKKDGKMCDHDMMEKCHSEMSKGDCKKMMKHAKSQNESTKRK